MGGGFQGTRSSNTRRFQQRHYEAVAEVLRDLKSSALVTVRPDTHAVWVRTVAEFAYMFGLDARRSEYGPFKVDLFMEACGADLEHNE